ncbi:MAG TPA: pilus assembly protein N-terminal domain-containing protein [Oligoflexia bacterium]|nr:pilus assembly protein N-terminal domain-containing protein [Oligoflexia bacterium]HMR25415.1 pilus assembly protein N-terminal domain-containing protein [Oligoflexia bacterium]
MRITQATPFIVILLALPLYAQKNIFLDVGHQKIIPGDNIVRVSIGNPKIADVTIIESNQEIILTGIKAGSTSLVIWKKNQQKYKYIVKVGHKSNASSLIKQIKQLQKIKTLYIQKQSNQYLIKGTLFKTQDLVLLESIKKNYHNIIDLSHFDKKSFALIHKLLQTKIHQYHFQNVFVEVEKNYFKLKGYVYNADDKKRVLLIAKSLYPLIYDQITIYNSQKPSVFIDVKFLEIHNSEIKNIGIQWPDAISAQANIATHNNMIQSTVSSGQSLNLVLQALSENGKAKVLSNPKILCRDGFVSSFLAGGEIPIRLISERVANVIFKPYGVSLKIKPHIHSSNNILLDLKIKISDLDSSVSIEGIPAMIEHHLQTSAQTQINQTVVLGGFFQDRMRKNVKRFPVLGTVPILGELFKSRSFQKKQSQFFILLTAYSGKAKDKYHSNLLEHSKTLNVNTNDYNFSLFD